MIQFNDDFHNTLQHKRKAPWYVNFIIGLALIMIMILLVKFLAVPIFIIIVIFILSAIITGIGEGFMESFL